MFQHGRDMESIIDPLLSNTVFSRSHQLIFSSTHPSSCQSNHFVHTRRGPRQRFSRESQKWESSLTDGQQTSIDNSPALSRPWCIPLGLLTSYSSIRGRPQVRHSRRPSRHSWPATPPLDFLRRLVPASHQGSGASSKGLRSPTQHSSMACLSLKKYSKTYTPTTKATDLRMKDQKAMGLPKKNYPAVTERDNYTTCVLTGASRLNEDHPPPLPPPPTAYHQQPTSSNLPSDLQLSCCSIRATKATMVKGKGK
ncbi:hypothetical protein V8F06_005344 [Rhypophila decipiens]